MTNYLADRIQKPDWRTAQGKKRPAGRRYVIGFDSEADTSSDGKPMMFQFSLPNTTEDETLTVVVPAKYNAGMGVFLDFLDEHCTKSSYKYLIYAWNLQYELTQLFHDLPDDVAMESDFEVAGIITTSGKRYEWTIKVLNYKRQLVEFRKGKIVVNMYDGMAFYKTSLDKAAKMLGLGEKYTSDSINRALFTRDDLDDVEYLKYAKRDAYITRLIGEYIQRQHEQQGIETTISAPHFAATVFTQRFLTDRNCLRMASTELEQAGLYSYHGGKNGFYLDGPTEFGIIYQYDITSAYPEAMQQLPDIEHCSWAPIKTYKPGIHGLYCITAFYNACTYRGFQDHDGTWVESGLVDNIWLTSYELDEMVARGEIIDFLSISGWEMAGPSGGALAEYVTTFFNIKKNTTGLERETAKLLLNSLYGKFFQKQPVGSVGYYNLETMSWIETNGADEFDYKAGGMYHPPIASLITGYVRAKIHRLEHRYDSIMTSTDGMFANNPPYPDDIGSDLGSLTYSKGTLKIWRERLYIYDAVDGTRKYALHGFRGSVSELEDIPLARGDYSYMGRQMITLKMSTRSSRGIRYSPGEFVKLPYLLRI